MWTVAILTLLSLSTSLRFVQAAPTEPSPQLQQQNSDSMRVSKSLLCGTLAASSIHTCAIAQATGSTKLYVSSYAGTITSLDLSKTAGGYSLKSVAVNTGSAPSTTWIEKDPTKSIIYVLDEGFTSPNGSFAAYTTSASGALTQINRLMTLGGPVSSVLYNGGKSIAVAHYGGSALSTYSVLPSGGLAPGENFIFTLSKPGFNPGRQEAPHPHEALLDPTGSFIVVPDLGADLVRIFSIDASTGKLTAQTPFAVTPGSGPRHGAFVGGATAIKGCNKAKTECLAEAKANAKPTFFFLISELSNTITSYKVTYGSGNAKTMSFEKVFESGTYGNQTTPVGAAAAEAIVSPDQKFLLTSSRNATIISIPNFDTANSTQIPSDTLQSWSICPDTGKLEFKQLAPAGGSFPRQFSMNKAGNLAAVGLQRSSRVVIVERNVADGTFGKIVANITVEGEVTAVVWDE
ncbi:Lactonase, 7-bladed beta-propeller-domain-containing protein [Tricladium varicosporioides]|nr:Lactonase, 7-bladed beta-propeller-domain-containing protein [Hymenoscyphus varicosporioides]